ncbi:hypothetical protein AGMMS49975_28370 [Clostridia bacterium]|nr:hypothetical protein AGMMS49975_28370 [Clostridia bacterium]
MKELRVSKGLSQKVLGEIVGLKQPTIRDMEHGRITTTLERASVFADYFKVSLDYLVGRSTDWMKNDKTTDSLASDEQELLETYRKLKEFNKGIVLGKSQTLLETQDKRGKK